MNGRATLLTPVLLSWVLWGCSAAGFVAGTAVDLSEPDSLRVSGWGFRSVSPGTRGELVTADGLSQTVEFHTLEQQDDVVYAQRYRSALTALPGATRLPDIGEEISVATRFKERAACLFQGFDPGRMWGLVGSNRVRGFVDLENATEITLSDGTTIDAGSLRELIFAGKVPCRSGIRTTVTDQQQRVFCVEGQRPPLAGSTFVPLDGIRYLTIPRQHNAKWWGALAGFAADVAWFAVSNASRW